MGFGSRDLTPVSTTKTTKAAEVCKCKNVVAKCQNDRSPQLTLVAETVEKAQSRQVGQVDPDAGKDLGPGLAGCRADDLFKPREAHILIKQEKIALKWRKATRPPWPD